MATNTFKLPSNVRPKNLASGTRQFYWEVPTKDRKRGCPIANVTLGADITAAISKANILNGMLKAWRSDPEGYKDSEKFAELGTIRWLVEEYLKSDAFLIKVNKRSHNDYRQALTRITDFSTRDGRSLGEKMVRQLDAPTARKIYYKIVGVDPDTFQPVVNTPIYRTGEMVVKNAIKAWDVVRGDYPQHFHVDHPNPWKSVALIKRQRKVKPHVDRKTVFQFAYGAFDQGYPTVGACAIICFEWLMRPENLCDGQLKWKHYRGEDNPDRVIVSHGKTKALSEHILFVRDEQGKVIETFYDDAVRYMNKLQRGAPDEPVARSDSGGLINKYRMSKIIRKLRTTIDGIPDHFTLDACRHGGMTEIEEKGLTEGHGRLLSAHKTSAAYKGYAKETDLRRIAAQRARGAA